MTIVTIPRIEEVRALNGRIFAMLEPQELKVLDFYRAQGRKFNVAVEIGDHALVADLALPSSHRDYDAVLRRANSRVTVTVGLDAEAIWAERVAASSGKSQ